MVLVPEAETGGYSPNQDALHQLPRHQQTTIFRLRTGHCRLNSHLKRTGVKASAQCPCGEADQTPEHYLQSCSLHQQARQQIWPTCVSLKTKLWGSAEEFVPDIQVCGTHGREDLVNATIASKADKEEEEEKKNSRSYQQCKKVETLKLGRTTYGRVTSRQPLHLKPPLNCHGLSRQTPCKSGPSDFLPVNLQL